MTAVGSKLVALVAQHEGLRLKPYRDTTGHWTIGYGLNLDAGITGYEADWLLRHRLRGIADALAARLPWWDGLDEVRRAVLVDMGYNLGVDGLLKFKRTLAAVERGDYEQAARGMLQSRWAGQVKSRAERLAGMMRTGRWPAGV